MGGESAAAYAAQGHDAVRSELEAGFFESVLPGLLAAAGGGRLLDLGCGDGLAARLAGPGVASYTGVDFCEAPAGFSGEYVRHDLREGLGPVGELAFDVYVGTFGVASHLRPEQLHRLLHEVATHARHGSIVALEALGLHSLEWPGLWGSSPGEGRLLPYRLAADVEVHPWSPDELGALFERAHIKPLAMLDRTVQAGPKSGDGRYWPAMPPVRQAMNDLLREHPDHGAARVALARSLAPLPACPAATFHHAVTTHRHRLLAAHRATGAPELARAIWGLEPRSGGGFGHGLLAVGRVP